MLALRFQRARAQFPFIAVSRAGQNSVWTYEIEPTPSTQSDLWTVRARPADERYDGVAYELVLQRDGDDAVRVVAAQNRLPGVFHGNGVAPVLYPAIAAHFRKQLMSGDAHPGASDRSRPARLTRVWEHLPSVGTATYDGTSGHYSIIDGRPGSPLASEAEPLETPPTNEAEFRAFIERIDADLRAEGGPTVGREMRGSSEVSRRLKLMLVIPMLAKGEPLPGVYEGIDLTIRVQQWFTERFGRKLHINFSPGNCALLVRGDVWLMKLPLLIGRFQLIATRDAPVPSAPMRVDDGRIEPYNVIESVDGLPVGLRLSLTRAELDEYLNIFKTAYGAYSALRHCSGEPFVPEATSDHAATVEHLAGPRAHYGQARWSALQAAQKMRFACVECRLPPYA